MGRCQPFWTHQETMGGDSASPTNPKWGRTEKPSKKYADRLKYVLIMETYVRVNGPG